MYVCICKAIKEKDIAELIQSGAVNSYDCAREKLGLGSCCGLCKSEANAFISEEVSKIAANISFAA